METKRQTKIIDYGVISLQYTVRSTVLLLLIPYSSSDVVVRAILLALDESQLQLDGLLEQLREEFLRESEHPVGATDVQSLRVL